MGNEHSSNNDRNKLMQQQIIKQVHSSSQNCSVGAVDENTKHIQIQSARDKKIRTQLEKEREILRRKEEELKRKELLLQKKMKDIQVSTGRHKPTQEHTFKCYQKKRKQEFQNEMDELQSIKVNPYDIFKIPIDFTLEQLKAVYKKLALKYHPDRPNGDEMKFKIITKIYLSLYEDYKTRQPDKQYMDLKNGCHNFIHNQESHQRRNKKLNKDKFNIQLFNKIYEENKLFEPTDDGYGKWLKSTENKSEPPKLFSKSFNRNVFNTVFNEEVKRHNKNRQMIEYKDPDAQETSISYSTLGQDKITDFSSHHSSENNYCDLKKAYTDTFLMTSDTTKRKKYNGLQDIKQHRNNISYTMSDCDKKRQEIINERIRNEELLRQQRVKDNDSLIQEHFHKMNHLFLQHQNQ